MEQSSLEVGLQRLLVQTKSGHVVTVNEIDHPEEINEPLGMVTHAWDRTAETGEISYSEYITDTGFLVRGDRIAKEDGIATTVNLPRRAVDASAVVDAAESAGSGGLLGRSGLTNRRQQYLLDNAKKVAGDLNRIFRQIVMEFWIGWYSAEGIAYGRDGIYDLDFANDATPEMRAAIVDDHKSRLVDQTRLAADQAEAVLTRLPPTIPVKIDVFADGEQIL